MTIYEAMTARHSVRSYEDRPIEGSLIAALREEIDLCNQEGGLSIQLITGDKDVFNGLLAHYGGFRSVSNYIALVGPAGGQAEETLGYYGERIALRAQQLGLNTCWVAATYKKNRCRAVVGAGQALVCVLALGYGASQGVPHRSKPLEALCRAEEDMPEWFRKGMEAAMLAPTAMNKQDFLITLEGEQAKFEAGAGRYGHIDLGIVRYHFELGAGRL